MKHTYEERLIAGLEAYGWVLDKTDRSHYKAFRDPSKSRKLFVGRNGALRSGEVASRSHSIGDASRHTEVYKMYLSAGDSRLHGADMGIQNMDAFTID